MFILLLNYLSYWQKQNPQNTIEKSKEWATLTPQNGGSVAGIDFQRKL
jgi:hypothetical protein